MHLIVNPAAAGGRVGKHWPHLRERLEGVGFNLPFSLTRAPGHASELAAEAVARGDEVVVVAGGDGTICEVVQGLHDAGRGVLAILPLGTGNDAARTLGLPLRLEDAARTVLAGVRRTVDLMRVGDRVVLNAVGIGLLGEINVRAAGMKHVRGIASYLAAAGVSLFRYPCPRVRLAGDGVSWEGDMTILAIHNGPTTGGGFRLTPAACPDDGVLDGCILGSTTVGERLASLVAALRGRLGQRRAAHEFTFTRLALSTDQALPCHLDGNIWSIEPPGVSFDVLPGGQTVVVPAS
jgi:YegS/Rv2252/BmrU family lipid kinase